MAQAVKKYQSERKKLSKKLGSQIIKPEAIELEKKRMMERFGKRSPKTDSTIMNLDSEQVYKMMKRKIDK